MPRPVASLSPINYTTAEHALGTILIATSATSLAAISLADTPAQALSDLKTSFPGRRLVPAKGAAHETHHDAVTAHLDAGKPLTLPKGLDGTPFQRAVWAAIVNIPRGETRTYAQLASSMGRPSATRAVARACATNRLALVIPCHRVLGAGGKMTGYRWGVERKRALLAIEQR